MDRAVPKKPQRQPARRYVSVRFRYVKLLLKFLRCEIGDTAERHLHGSTAANHDQLALERSFATPKGR